MIRRFLWLFFIIAIVMLQTTVLPRIISAYFKPDLLLIMVVFLGLRSETEGSAITGFLLGIVKDILSGLYLGLNGFLFLAVFLVLKNTSDRLYAESAELFVVAVAFATIATISASILLVAMFTPSPSVAYSMFYALIPNLVMNTFVASLVGFFPVFSSPTPETV